MGNIIGNIFNTILIHPIFNILIAIYQFLLYLHVPYALGFAIILLTALTRLILYPVMASQMRTTKKMQTLNPHLAALKEKHKGDNVRLQQETMRLYQEHGVNPAAGCLPLLIQLPIIWGLYGVLQSIVKYTSAKQINEFLYFDFLKVHTWGDSTTQFFGLPLTKSPSKLMTTVGVLILLIPLVTAVLQYFQSKAIMPTMAAPQKDPKKKGTDSKTSSEDFAAAFQTQSLYIFPLMIGFFSWSLPLGLSLYWNTFSIFGIIQQRQLQKAHEAEQAVKIK